jgi:hypothetical protein
MSCPADMLPLSANSTTCMDRNNHAVALSWPEAVATCSSLGRRLCTAAEWQAACNAASGISGLLDGWEWLAELQTATETKKAGAVDCATISYHDQTGAYQVRCCLSIARPATASVVYSGKSFVDRQRTAAASWIQQASSCMTAGKRLCSGAEWLAACGCASTLGLTDIQGSEEWIGELVTVGVAKTSAPASCAVGGSGAVFGVTHAARCCY